MPEQATTIAPMLTPDSFAALLGISRRCFQSWRAAGKLPAPDLAEGKVIRWRLETVDGWIKDGASYRNKNAAHEDGDSVTRPEAVAHEQYTT